MPKNTAAKIGCGSFDQHDLQSLNNYKHFLFFCNYNFEHFGAGFGACNILLEIYFQDLSLGILHASHILKITVAKQK